MLKLISKVLLRIKLIWYGYNISREKKNDKTEIISQDSILHK